MKKYDGDNLWDSIENRFDIVEVDDEFIYIDKPLKFMCDICGIVSNVEMFEGELICVYCGNVIDIIR